MLTPTTDHATAAANDYDEYLHLVADEDGDDCSQLDPCITGTENSHDETTGQQVKNTVPTVGNSKGSGNGKSLYYDVASLLDGTMPAPPQATLALRDDGHGILYPGEVNLVFGDPESGKTWFALWAAVQALNAGHKVLVVDLDHNGPQATIYRLMAMGATREHLSNPAVFRYVEPEDAGDLHAIVTDAKQWKPDIVTVDSMGELLPLYGSNSNSADDFTLVNRQVLKPLAMAGACVAVIDHLAKGSESRQQGPGGTAAKRRAIGGVSLRVTVDKQFNPSQGGAAHLHVNKDRHGSVRAVSKEDRDEQYAGRFVLESRSEHVIIAKVEAPQHDGPGLRTADHPASIEADVKALRQLDPPPSGRDDVLNRMKWQTARAATAWGRYSEAIVLEAVEDAKALVNAKSIAGSTGMHIRTVSTCLEKLTAGKHVEKSGKDLYTVMAA